MTSTMVLNKLSSGKRREVLGRLDFFLEHSVCVASL